MNNKKLEEKKIRKKVFVGFLYLGIYIISTVLVILFISYVQKLMENGESGLAILFLLVAIGFIIAFALLVIPKLIVKGEEDE